MTLSFHKVMFSADEVLDLIIDLKLDHEDCECSGLSDLEDTFTQKAEDRSRT